MRYLSVTFKTFHFFTGRMQSVQFNVTGLGLSSETMAVQTHGTTNVALLIDLLSVAGIITTCLI
jgi:hypothetical protein